MSAQKKARKDKLLFIFIILSAVALAVVFWAIHRGMDAPNVTIKTDGKVYYSGSIKNPEEIRVPCEDNGYVVVVIQDSKAYVKESSCPDKVCVKTEPATKPGHIITCLPNHVTVEITDDKQAVEVDSEVR